MIYCSGTAERQNIQTGEVGPDECVLLEFLGPREKRNEISGLRYQDIHLFAKGFIHYWNHTLKFSSDLFGVVVSLNETDVGLHYGSNVLDPPPLGVFVGFDQTRVEVFDVGLQHVLLIDVGGVRNSSAKIFSYLSHDVRQVTVMDLHQVGFVSLGVVVNSQRLMIGTHHQYFEFLASLLLKDTCV